MYTAQVNFVSQNDRTKEPIGSVRVMVRGNALVTEVIEEAVKQMRTMGDNVAIRDITLRPLWWNNHSVNNCQEQPIGGDLT
jgi:hypothetical protein